MKALLRSPLVQNALAFLISSYLLFTYRTMRWTYIDLNTVDRLIDAPEGIIGCFWHGRIMIAAHCEVLMRQKPRRVLISLSRDGEFVAKAVERLGMPSIRGSSGRGGGGKGGAKAFIQALRFLRDGGIVAVTPDGPRGPSQVMTAGPLALAKASGAPVVLFGLAASPAVSLGGWDSGRMPLPFTRGSVAFDGPYYVPPDATEADIESLRQTWGDLLTATQVRAERFLAGETAAD